MMKSLLIVAHGSRREDSNNEVRLLADTIQKTVSEQAELVKAAFLELAEPSIPDGIQQCIDAGATEVLVYPYFLTRGRHVVTDIPNEVAIKVKEHPHVNILILPHLGAMTGIPELILKQSAQG